MKQPHKHAEVIKAWADGAEIEYRSRTSGVWNQTVSPLWDDDYDYEYRVKPEAKPDRTWHLSVGLTSCGSAIVGFSSAENANLVVTLDGETGEIKSVEVVK